MKKRISKAQTTIFVILALFIILIAGIAVYFYPKQRQDVEIEVQPVHSFVTDCLRQTAENSIERIGETGGNSEDSLLWYFYKGKKYVPEKNQIENNISFYIEKNLNKCLNDFNSFSEFDIQTGKINAETQIIENKVITKLKYPLTISKAEKNYNYDEFQEIIPVRLGIVYNAASEIIEDQLTHPETLCITCIGDIAIKYDLYVDVEPYNNETFVFRIRDENSRINEKDFEFRFITGY
ncbi:hypothetical protein GF386_02980 [Candidatus Pacearchaeota archaeon]|nr:hypothetical protein [Candidatus Pacearchaeota archaeon]MBD3283103.1 hypothetical protein [Candidatus Pacearchaeota archaeon]